MSPSRRDPSRKYKRWMWSGWPRTTRCHPGRGGVIREHTSLCSPEQSASLPSLYPSFLLPGIYPQLCHSHIFPFLLTFLLLSDFSFLPSVLYYSFPSIFPSMVGFFHPSKLFLTLAYVLPSLFLSHSIHYVSEKPKIQNESQKSESLSMQTALLSVD